MSTRDTQPENVALDIATGNHHREPSALKQAGIEVEATE
jgi:hypothetical protein